MDVHKLEINESTSNFAKCFVFPRFHENQIRNELFQFIHTLLTGTIPFLVCKYLLFIKPIVKCGIFKSFLSVGIVIPAFIHGEFRIVVD